MSDRSDSNRNQKEKNMDKHSCFTYQPSDLELNDIRNRFTYHSPIAGQPERYTMIRDEAHLMAGLLLGECPPSRERSLALTHLEDAVMWANASIARNEKATPDA